MAKKILSKKHDSWFKNVGYKSEYSKYSNSSFWIDDDFLSKETSKAGVDVVKLAGYKRAVSNFVRIVTGRVDIPVKFSSGTNSYTDGKSVVISSKLGESEFDTTVGLALHEGSHIALTDFKGIHPELSLGGSRFNSLMTWINLERPMANISNISIRRKSELGSLMRDLFNIIEDRRIDHFVYSAAPGYAGYYQSMYNTYFNSPAVDHALRTNAKTEGKIEDYVFHICNFANANRRLDSMPGLRDIWNVIDLQHIGRLKNSIEVLDVVDEVWKLITLHAIDLSDNTNDDQDKQDEPEEPTNNGNGIGGASGDDDNDDNNLDQPQTPKSAKEQAAEAKAKKAEAKLERDLEKAIQQQKDFLNGKMSKKGLTKKDATLVNAASEANMSYVDVGEPGRITRCVVVKGITDSIIDSGILGDHCLCRASVNRYKQKDTYFNYINDGITLGTMLGKRLKTRDEERSLKSTRQETGKIDRRLINELGFGNSRVFAQVFHQTVTPSIVHISVDASGSMNGRRWKTAMKTAIAIAKAGTMVSSLDVVISIRGSISIQGNGAAPLMWTVYDSRTDSFNAMKEKFHYITTSGSTPEGLCYQAVMNDIIKSSNGKESFFINLCDGEPGFCAGKINYGGEFALNHTRKQVDKMRAAGIKVLSYFIYDDYIMDKSVQNHKSMYGKDAEQIDLDSLTQLSKSINNLFERA